MSSYQPPTENLPEFNSAVFDSANTESLSLSKAQSLFLGRTGTPTSVATTTTFTNDIYANSIRVGRGGAIANTNVSLGGTISSSANYCTTIGSGTSAQNSNATCIGYGSQALNNYSTAIGSNASATGANQIVLGTATETVYCVGTASNTSLVATSNITVAGLTVGATNVASTTFNTILGVNACGGSGTGVIAFASGNTCIGNLAGSKITSTTFSTFVGYQAGQNTTGGANSNTGIGQGSLSNNTNGYNHTAVGYNSGVSSTGLNNTVSIGLQAKASGNYGCSLGVNATSAASGLSIGSGSTTGASSGINGVAIGSGATTGAAATGNGIAIGYQSSAAADSVAIGVGATATANQVVLGGTADTVVCKGTTANGSIQLAGGLVLQTGAYGTIASNMLGYSITIGGASVAVATTAVNLCSITPIPVGVWIINYTTTITSAGSSSFNAFQMGVSTVNANFANLISPSGFYISYATESSSVAGTFVRSGSFTYTNATGSSATLYILVQLGVLTGTFTGVATSYLTRIA